jgi:xanthine dehydrogenase YagT iron-sulfur-binding subunit
VLSCLTFAAACTGREVETIDGLATGGTLHPIQQAFLDAGALQCGFCTPGQLMSALCLLEEAAAGGRSRSSRSRASTPAMFPPGYEG